MGDITKCTRCGGELYQRKDDMAETVSNRLKVYDEQTKPLVDFYTNVGTIKNLDAAKSISEVYEKIVQILDNL